MRLNGLAGRLKGRDVCLADRAALVRDLGGELAQRLMLGIGDRRVLTDRRDRCRFYLRHPRQVGVAPMQLVRSFS